MKRTQVKYDIAVIGAGPGGLPAAIKAAREGLSVILVEKNGCVGGNILGSLSWLAFLDMQGRRVIGGIANEFVERLKEVGASNGHSPCPVHSSTTSVDINRFQIEALRMCTEAGVDLLLHSELTGVEVINGRIEKVTVFGKCQEIEIEAKIFIDATGDGDIGYLAGATYDWGTEDTGAIMPCSVPFLIENVNEEVLFDFLDHHPEYLRQGWGISTDFFRNSKDYCFVEMTPFLKEIREKGDTRFPSMLLNFCTTPVKGRVFLNVSRISDIDITDVFHITKAEIKGRLEIPDTVDFLREHVPGFENCRLCYISPFLGTRESRRLKGIKKLCVEDIRKEGIPEDAVALCSYFLDGIKPNSLDGSKGFDRSKWLEKPYGIPYGCLVNKELPNLMMTGRCISVDSAVLTSCRIMPVCMALGEAAGAGAALAVKNQTDPALVDAKDVRDSLRAGGAIVSTEDIVPNVN